MPELGGFLAAAENQVHEVQDADLYLALHAYLLHSLHLILEEFELLLLLLTELLHAEPLLTAEQDLVHGGGVLLLPVR